MDLGWYGDDDVVGAVTFLLGRADVRDGRVGVVGLSMGGEEALGAAAADARIRAVVAEGATGRGAADDAWLSDEYGVRGWIQEGLGWTTQWITDRLTDAASPTPLRDAVAAGRRPVLLIAAGAVADESHAARHIASGAPEPVAIWVAPGAGHTGALATHPDEWTRRVVGFIDAALAPPP